MRKTRSNINMVEPLKFWRARRGYSQSRLAKLASTSALTIGQLESGKRKGRGKTLGKILQGFNLTEEEFFSMREGGPQAQMTAPAEMAARDRVRPIEAPKPAPVPKDVGMLRLSNLDLELLNRILNLDFDGKLEALRFLQAQN
jgi:transcriptional regulator with XRE-family HTH domain